MNRRSDCAALRPDITSNRKSASVAQGRTGGCLLSDEALTDRLVQEMLHWRIAQDRFILPNRGWIPRWKFDPLKRIEHAFRLLAAIAPIRYTILFSSGEFRVDIRLKDRTGRASGDLLPRVIAQALAHALGVNLARKT